MKLFRTVAASLALLLPLTAAYAQDIKERTIKFSFLNEKEHPQGLGAQKFADLVASKSGNKMKVRLFPGGTLGGDLQTLSALQGGTVEMTVLNAGLLSSLNKEFSALDLPFLFNDAKEADAVVDGPFGKRLFDKLPEKGLVGLGYWDLGFRNLSNSKRPVAKLEDIAGLKIRVVQSPVYIDLFNTLGANAVPMPFPEVYTALEQKAIDGQENPLATIYSSKFHEVQKYITMTRHIYNPQALLMSKKFWDQLSAPEKKVIADAAHEAQAYQRQVSREKDAVAAENLKKAGIQINELPPAEIARIREKVKPVVAKASGDIKDAVAELNSEIAKVRK
ncbi:tripartite ATP-independent transporter solute receptor, DctP family [Noviherbaspirillum humi]|uniref:Tripartite ATP-independent transporter solute receptor, DctP family n=1 Tax=Noviherbaspirillum humi TaxID=1688639 RepID=A0A239HTE2_9BURK|nr:TRAP transporter substrate-binding protein [Noviherbaspirillum humi]SNS84606.1 tripartite ATP-independent transporter solute receptor, DctP family [Noviherbaspirillum humi]